MSRNQFVRNTLTAIQTQVQPSPRVLSTSDLFYDDGTASVRGAGSSANTAASPTDTLPRSKRSDSITSWSSISRDTFASSVNSMATTQVTTPGGYLSNDGTNGSTPSVQMSSPSTEHKPVGSSVTYDRVWEVEMENLLKVGLFGLCLPLLHDTYRICIMPSRANKSCSRLVLVALRCHL